MLPADSLTTSDADFFLLTEVWLQLVDQTTKSALFGRAFGEAEQRLPSAVCIGASVLLLDIPLAEDDFRVLLVFGIAASTSVLDPDLCDGDSLASSRDCKVLGDALGDGLLIGNSASVLERDFGGGDFPSLLDPVCRGIFTSVLDRDFGERDFLSSLDVCTGISVSFLDRDFGERDFLPSSDV